MDDPFLQEFPSLVSRLKSDHETSSVLPNHLVTSSKLGHESIDPHPLLLPTNAHTPSSNLGSSSRSGSEGDFLDNGDFSSAVLKYIHDVLMEEDLEGQTCVLEDCLALQAAEKSFYDVLSEKCPFSSKQSPFFGQNSINSDGNFSWIGSNDNSNTYATAVDLVESSWIFDQVKFESSHMQNSLLDSLERMHQVPDLYSESLLNGGSLIPLMPPGKDAKDYLLNNPRDRTNRRREDTAYSEGRTNKHSAFSFEEPEETEILLFDKLLLHETGNDESESCALHNASQNRASGNNGQTKGSHGRTTRSKRKGSKRETVDLWSLLSQCAQAVAGNEQKTANELIRQIRQHSSPLGDGNQRLAHYFANGLEARLAGSGTPGYTPIVSSKTSAADLLKAYRIQITACPFRRMSNFFANQNIVKLAEKATRLHIIDFGILNGFQWPCVIEHLSTRPGGPPKLHITGIDFPQPGFRPAERIEETGRRLKKFCERFNVPFEYNCIAQKWETIQYEDLKIDRDEIIIVNCQYRFKNLPDDTMAANNPRDTVLKLIKKINPDAFIYAVVNGTYNAPFFITRFRDALFHFSALFDMIETTLSREDPARLMIEKEIFGRYAMNVIACEGAERLERPETYKRWQIRILRAGFRQLPIDQEILKKVRTVVKSNYNENFVIDEDGAWMLQGWKGRIVYAISAWKPVHD